MRLIALLTCLITGVRGYAADSLAAIAATRSSSSRARAASSQLLRTAADPHMLYVCGGGLGGAGEALRQQPPPRLPPACEHHWLCGGGKGACGKRRSAAAAARREQRCASSLLRMMCAEQSAEDGQSPVDDAASRSSSSEPAAAAAGGGGGGDTEPTKPVLILGAGWVGSRLARSLIGDGVDTIVTNRPGTDVSSKPPYFRPCELSCPPCERLEFDLNNPKTWESLPDAESISAAVITFPILHPETFWEAYLKDIAALNRPILIYSTTSVYRVDVPGQLVDESTPLRETPRSLGEQYMQERGTTVLTISGIFGDQRTPRAICTCLSTYTSAGGALNGRKRVNMVHVDDIVAASRRCLSSPQLGRRINVAGHHFYLSQLIQHCKHPAVPDMPDTDLSSKMVSSDVLLNELMPDGFDFVQPVAAKKQKS